VELTASACTFPGGTVGTDPEVGEKQETQGGGGIKEENGEGAARQAKEERERRTTMRCGRKS